MFLSHTKRRKPAELRIHCDEVGRGPLAGPVTVGCALAIGKPDLTPYKDSKQLTAKQRECFYKIIKNKISLNDHIDIFFSQSGLCHKLLNISESSEHSQKNILLTTTGRASAEEIDTHGIIQAINLACRRAIGQLLQKYYEQILRDQLLQSDFGEDIIAMRQYEILFSQEITEQTVLERQAIPNSYAYIPGLVRDGNHTFGLDKMLGIPVVTIIKGDQKNRLISVASIVAKVERDAYMTQLAEHFPAYALEKHKGYGTTFHRDAIATHGITPLHRTSFCKNISLPRSVDNPGQYRRPFGASPSNHVTINADAINADAINADAPKARPGIFGKPNLLLHICCAPDLTRPLRWLKDHFKLYLFRYNPNIHPRGEHDQRYAQFIKLVGLEPGDYEILEDRYDPQEFFHAMVDHKESIDPTLKNATKKQILTQASRMEEWSDRCNPCYSSRLHMAAKMAAQHHIPYFTSTLLISPKKIAQKLYQRGKDAQEHYPTTTFLRFDFAKHGGYQKAVELTRAHDLRRQNYCGCGRSLPKPSEKRKAYRGG